MNRKNPHSLPAAKRSSLDALQAFAEIYLTSAERLTVLNLASAREMLEQTVAASRQKPSTENESGFNLPQLAFSQPSFQKAVTYSRSVYEILLESQQEIIKTLSSQFSDMNANFKLPAEATAPFEVFSKLAKAA
jgi:phasin family protein